jgi:arylsulfatase A-like enzyme
MIIGASIPARWICAPLLESDGGVSAAMMIGDLVRSGPPWTDGMSRARRMRRSSLNRALMFVVPTCVGVSLCGLGLVPGRVSSTARDPDRGAASQRASSARPNIVVLRTDDQDERSMRIQRPDGTPIMQHVIELIAREGTTFRNSFTPISLCCPSRVSFLTGLYGHNNHVIANGPPAGGYSAFHDTNALPVWLQSAGYYDVHIGKYLNGYFPGAPIPSGWREWYTGFGEHYFLYQLNENGALVDYYGHDAAHYSTDVFTDKAVEFIQRGTPHGEPFFLVVDYIAPHKGPVLPGSPYSGQPEPAPRHQGELADLVPPLPPSFNVAPPQPPLPAGDLRFILELYRNRLESLLAVDEGVDRIIHALAAKGELENTYVFFMSDNGFQLGEHQLLGKGFLLEESIHVPLVVRGPGVPRGVERDEMVANIDLAPTIAELAGATPGLDMDGKSLVALMKGRTPATWREHLFLMQRFTQQFSFPTPVTGVRTADYLYVEHDDDGDGIPEGVELYNFKPDPCGFAGDPYELENQARASCNAPILQRLHSVLQQLSACSGRSCW